MSDFLISRKQQVFVDGIKSSIFEVTLRVRQGSLLGSLFLIFLNLVVKNYQEDVLYLFTNDLKVF